MAAAPEGLSGGAGRPRRSAPLASRPAGYLEYLADNCLAQRELHYGQVGRPEVFYRLTRV